MENNNYNENGTNRTDNINDSYGANAASDTDNSQQEVSSTYRYSYMDQNQKNPNNIWRADENTGSADTGSAAGQFSQTGTGSDYTGQTGQAGVGSGYTGQTGQAGAGSGYTGQTGAYSSYYGSANNANAYTGQSNSANAAYTGQTGNANSANATYTGQTGNANNANAAYTGQAGNAYSNMNGAQGSQSGYQTYTDGKAQKKAERAKRRAEKHTGGSSNFGIKIAKCASIALIFGLVAGTAFEGSSYVAGNLLGTNQEQVQITAGEDREVLNAPDKTENTATVVQQASTSNSDGVAPIVKQCMPSIVSITNLSQVRVQNFFGQVQSYEVPSAGSGIIISEDNDYLYIATNNHVVTSSNAQSTLTIQFCDDTTVAAEIKGTDKSTDLAVVQVKKSDVEADTLAAIKVATFGDSDKLEVGAQAIAIGNALGYGQSVTAGYISAIEREVTMEDETTGESFTNNLIQTDAAINPGNSGGALLNSSGEVIGINSSKYSDTDVEGMGFAIPANMAKPIIEDLITKEEVTGDKAAYLGITGQNVTSAISEAYNMPEGVFVKEVTKGTAAEQYGIKAGDIITKFDGKEIKTMETLQKRLSYCEAGTEVEIEVKRWTTESGFDDVTLKVVLGQKNS